MSQLEAVYVTVIVYYKFMLGMPFKMFIKMKTSVLLKHLKNSRVV